MTSKLLGVAAASALALAACSEKPAEVLVAQTPPPVEAAAAPAVAPPSIEGLPAGDYKIDPAHASLVFTVNHLGFSHYTGQFTRFTADLKLDPANPAAAQLSATVDPASLSIPSPPDGFVDELSSEPWLNTKAFPQMTFKSTSIAVTGPNTADVTGDFTLRGVTKPVTLAMTFNGGWRGIPQDPHARIGFSAKGVLKRSEFGIDFGVPAPGSTAGVSDDVTIAIEAEFTGPPMADQPAQ
ncbi:MAG: polyisoprenoid-binding protein [Burkholderiales bacterium]|nr:MAG: polyisoprenoid-binding protein [Burkholderiales bacterium]